MRDNFEYQNFDEETLRRVELNDPDVRGLTIPQDVDWIDGSGRIIGENTSLRGIKIDVGSDDGVTQYWLQELFQGLARNRSIESLELTFHCDVIPEEEVDVFPILAPFFENNSNLHYLGVNKGLTQIKSLASVLSNCDKTKSQLQCVEMLACPFLDEDTELLLNSFHGIPTLLELKLFGSTLGWKGCMAIAELLNKSNIHTLGLENSELDEDCTYILSNAMITKNNVTSLSLSHMSEPKAASWQISTLALSNPTCILEKLFLACTHIDDEGVTALGCALAINRTLKCLDLSCIMFSITAKGWQGFSECLRNGNSVLEDLDISACCVDDDGAAAIVNALVGNSSLKRLGMGYNDLITTAGWTSVFYSLLNFVPSLEELEVFEDILAENDWTDTMDWSILSRALCDTSSIDRTYVSNHTFHSLPGYQGSDLHGAVPDDILPLLLMNRNEKNKAEVARKKILKFHFAEGKANSNIFTCFPLTIMPFAIEWIGRGNGELSLMYNVLQESPELFDIHQRPQGGAEVVE